MCSFEKKMKAVESFVKKQVNVLLVPGQNEILIFTEAVNQIDYLCKMSHL